MKRISEKMIRDVMTRGVVTACAGTSLIEVTKMLASQQVSGIAITSADGDVLGFISETDILKALAKPDLEHIIAEDVMSSRLVSIAPDATIGRAAKIMEAKHVHRLLVLSEKRAGSAQRPIGILSASDIVRMVAEMG
ncbi:MAG: CBS domain-containing protein [Euryarchaeota archaeon]|nr:MAG: Inosine-5'-monophosphate dehydrogenase [ANME-2 cluster archaeon]MEA1865344.1 CBS domain-containing protein [Euryarchaeota archaeon]